VTAGVWVCAAINDVARTGRDRLTVKCGVLESDKRFS
jgi:hypothetical protein